MPQLSAVSKASPLTSNMPNPAPARTSNHTTNFSPTTLRALSILFPHLVGQTPEP